MRIISLAWYICAVCLLLMLLASSMTWHPDIQFQGGVLATVLGIVGLLMGGVAIAFGGLPKTHRVHQSKSLWGGMVAFAVTVTALLVLVG
ncbi:MAG: hypothetical protein ACKV0T_07905 [Planctomycetales bacterium]